MMRTKFQVIGLVICVHLSLLISSSTAYEDSIVLNQKPNLTGPFEDKDKNIIYGNFDVYTQRTSEFSKLDTYVQDRFKKHVQPGAVLQLIRESNNFNLIPVQLSAAPISGKIRIGMKGEKEFDRKLPSDMERVKNDLVNSYIKENPDQKLMKGGFPTRSIDVYSGDQLRVAFKWGPGLEELIDSLDEAAIQKKEKQVKVDKYESYFYTVDAEAPENFNDNFARSEKVEQYFQEHSEGMPIRINTLVYGRMLFVKTECEQQKTNCTSQLFGVNPDERARFESVKGNATLSEDYIWEVLGGSATNIGHPVYFTAKDKTGNSVTLEAEAYYGLPRIYNSTRITLQNPNLSKVNAKVTYDTFDIDQNRAEIIRKKQEKLETIISKGKEETFVLKGDSRNIVVEVIQPGWFSDTNIFKNQVVRGLPVTYSTSGASTTTLSAIFLVLGVIMSQILRQ